MSQRLGYIGLGIMGAPMALNLLKHGHALTVWNRTPPEERDAVRAVIDAGATWVGSPAQVAEASDIVFLNLTDTAAVEQVLFSVMGVAAGADEKRGCIVVDHSTIGPLATRQFAERLEHYRITLVDAPVSGGDVGARDGTLSVMVGGPPEVFAALLPVLACVGETITHVGETGMGQACKACNQVAVVGALSGVCEALALARGLGLDPSVMLEVVGAGAGGSWQLSRLGPRVVAGDFAPGFMVELLRKDLSLVREAGGAAGVPTPLAELVSGLLAAVAEMGASREGTQALAKAWMQG